MISKKCLETLIPVTLLNCGYERVQHNPEVVSPSQSLTAIVNEKGEKQPNGDVLFVDNIKVGDKPVRLTYRVHNEKLLWCYEDQRKDFPSTVCNYTINSLEPILFGCIHITPIAIFAANCRPYNSIMAKQLTQ